VVVDRLVLSLARSRFRSSSLWRRSGRVRGWLLLVAVRRRISGMFLPGRVVCGAGFVRVAEKASDLARLKALFPSADGDGGAVVLLFPRQIDGDVFFSGGLSRRILFPLIFLEDGGGDSVASTEDSRWRFVLYSVDGIKLLCFPLGSFPFRVGEFIIDGGFIFRLGCFGVPGRPDADCLDDDLALGFFVCCSVLAVLGSRSRIRWGGWSERWRSLTTDALFSRTSCGLTSVGFTIWARGGEGGVVWSAQTRIEENNRNADSRKEKRDLIVIPVLHRVPFVKREAYVPPPGFLLI